MKKIFYLISIVLFICVFLINCKKASLKEYNWKEFKNICDTQLGKIYQNSDVENPLLKIMKLDKIYFMGLKGNCFIPERATPNIVIEKPKFNPKKYRAYNHRMLLKGDLLGTSDDEYILSISYNAPTGGHLFIYDNHLRLIDSFKTGCMESMQILKNKNTKDILEICSYIRNGNMSPIRYTINQYYIKETRNKNISSNIRAKEIRQWFVHTNDSEPK